MLSFVLIYRACTVHLLRFRNHLYQINKKHIPSYFNSIPVFRKFYFAIGCSADMKSCGEGEGRTSVNINDVVASGIRKLLELDRSMNVLRGAPGRLSIACGSLASSIDQWNTSMRAEEKAIQKAAVQAAQMEMKTAAGIR